MDRVCFVSLKKLRKYMVEMVIQHFVLLTVYLKIGENCETLPQKIKDKKMGVGKTVNFVAYFATKKAFIFA